jgi:hypothetical protein
MKRKIAILLVICLSAAFFLCSCHIEDKIESPKRRYDIKIAGESASVDIELECVCYENLNF